MFLWLIPATVICLYLRYPYFFQDIQYVLSKLKIRLKVLRFMKTHYTILDRFEDTAKALPHKPLLLFKDETFSYQDAEKLSNKAARAFRQTGLVQEGDTVTLFLGNEPMFLWLWLGLTKIGCSVAFLNYNIRSKSLLHCFSRSGARILVVAEGLLGAVEEVLPSLLEQEVTVFILADACATEGVRSFTDEMKRASSEPLPKDLRSRVTLQSPAVYVYTSGTTGLPKAAVISHTKLWMISSLLQLTGVHADDVIYISLPLYHTAAFAAFTSAFEKGVTVALRSKFSASQFWDDCRKYNVTVIQYIGEIMRYLCNTPKKPNDRSHKVRLAIGNGVRQEVWKEFASRFGNIKVREFYGATEGNIGLLNYTNKAGAIGRHTLINRRFFPYAVIKFDVEKEEPVRDSSGLCIEVPKGEPGLLVSEITVKSPFVGYARDLQQTEKKKLHNVLKKGDIFFNTGDLVLIDKDDFIYFQDRVGDTFRWKGENVATTEVADIIALEDCIAEANVYGVEVPGQEGKAGMAAVTLTDGHTFDAVGIFKHLESFLPPYARPRFLRIQSSLDITGTYKLLKAKLVAEGFNPSKVTDPLYFLDEKEKTFVPLTLDVFNSVTSGKIRF